MTLSKIVHEYWRRYPAYHFFDKDTLEFFGEIPSEMKVLEDTQTVKGLDGDLHECYVISSIQHKLNDMEVYHYFDTETFMHVNSHAIT